MPRHYAQRTAAPDLRRKPARDSDDLAPGIAPHQLIQLQRTIGNAGVRALLAKQGPAAPRLPAVQRFWGDDEETDSGGSWLDQATETVGGWFSGDDSDSGGSTPANPENSWAGGSDGGETQHGNPDSGGSTPANPENSWAGGSDGGDTGYSSESDSESGESEGDEGGFWDWLPDLPEFDLPDISGDEAAEDAPPPVVEIPDIETTVVTSDEGVATCVSGHGSASGGGVSVAGNTTANFATATATSSLVKPAITPRQAGGKTVYDVTGTVHIDYALADEPNVDYRVVPGRDTLSECKQQKVDAFIAGDLGAHEAKHVAAFKTFNGSEDHVVSFTGIEADSTESLTAAVQARVDAFVKEKTTARQTMAKGNSAKLDPWSQAIPGIGSCP
jgi:hypothetical protein